MTSDSDHEPSLLQNEFIFYLRISQLFRSVQNTYWVQNLLKLNKQPQRSIPNENQKIYIHRRCRSRSLKYAELRSICPNHCM